MKTCFKCGLQKPTDDFYRHPQMGDGFLGKCKECTKADVRANRKKRIRYYRKYDRLRSNEEARVLARLAYAKTPEGRAANVRSHRASREKYPGKTRARYVVSNAIRDGKLKRGPCEVCGNPKTHGHHDDYRRPLVVRWLCDKHHREHHRMNP